MQDQTNQAKESIQGRIEPFVSFLCQTITTAVTAIGMRSVILVLDSVDEKTRMLLHLFPLARGKKPEREFCRSPDHTLSSCRSQLQLNINSKNK